MIFTPQNQVPQGAQIKWTADDPNGEFWRSAQGGTYTKIGTGTVTVNNVSSSITSVKTGRSKAELIGIPAAQIGSSCYAYVKIPIEEISCKELKVDHPQNLRNTVSVLNSQVWNHDKTSRTK